MIDWVAAPFDQLYEVLTGAVSMTEPPVQKVVGPPAVMAGAGGLALTVTTTGELAVLHPFAVTVTL
jgi:hypothetical protein